MDEMRKGQTAFLIGQRVYLRPVEKEDAVYIKQWANDPQIRRLTAEVTPMTQGAVDGFLTKVYQDPDRVWFMVVLKENDRVIGEAGLLRMFPPWRTTDLTIILGEPDVWGQGYGTEAIRLLLEYAFGQLNLHRVALGVVGLNERAIRFYESVGFRTEGIQRDGYYYDHAYHDFVMMSILEEEFRQHNGSKANLRS